MIVRHVYVTRNENLEPVNFIKKEIFLGVYAAEDHSYVGLKEFTLNFMNKKGISVKKCYGQGNDSAFIMSGIPNGLQ
ncbi:hypothetical protein X975_07096, partial [Stegodyphus mimosarum]